MRAIKYAQAGTPVTQEATLDIDIPVIGALKPIRPGCDRRWDFLVDRIPTASARRVPLVSRPQARHTSASWPVPARPRALWSKRTRGLAMASLLLGTVGMA